MSGFELQTRLRLKVKGYITSFEVQGERCGRLSDIFVNPGHQCQALSAIIGQMSSFPIKKRMYICMLNYPWTEHWNYGQSSSGIRIPETLGEKWRHSLPIGQWKCFRSGQGIASHHMFKLWSHSWKNFVRVWDVFFYLNYARKGGQELVLAFVWLVEGGERHTIDMPRKFG